MRHRPSQDTPRLDEHTDGGIIAGLLVEARSQETPPARLCVDIALEYERHGHWESAYEWLARSIDSGDSFVDWNAAAQVMKRLITRSRPNTRRSVRLAVAASFTTDQLVDAIQLACLRRNIDVELYQAPFDQYQQVAFDPSHDLHRFNADFILLAVHEADANFPDFSEEPEIAIERELQRWVGIWSGLKSGSDATIIQHNFVLRPEEAFGHLSARLAGTRRSMLRTLNQRLGEASAEEGIVLVDCERLASDLGKRTWFDDRYWHISKQAVSLHAVPYLARHIAAVLAAHLGLTKKCLVLDLDGTLWGGIVGEDGLTGIDLGSGAGGEAFVALQDYILQLKQRGVVLAVCSKNEESQAREPFLRHPDMRLKLDDFSVFLANWRPKVENLRQIADELNLGMDALVFLDDNPIERQQIRELLPAVEVPALGADPSQYVRSLDDTLLFEPATFTAEDAERTDQYRARARAESLRTSSRTLEDFYRDLGMKAAVLPFDEFTLPRVAQLVSKTNQFNLTTRRHSLQDLHAFMEMDETECIRFCVRLHDRFGDHGITAVMIATQVDGAMNIDTWLMSCRVIGRTLDRYMARHLGILAREAGYAELTGTYIPTPKNALVSDLYQQLGFELVGEANGSTLWRYDLTKGMIASDFIEPVEAEVVDELV